jgi:hypothetical protein
MKTYVKVYIAVVAIAILFPYLLLSFLDSNFSPKNWGPITILLEVCMTIILLVIGLSIAALFDFIDYKLKQINQL